MPELAASLGQRIIRAARMAALMHEVDDLLDQRRELLARCQAHSARAADQLLRAAGQGRMVSDRGRRRSLDRGVR